MIEPRAIASASVSDYSSVHFADSTAFADPPSAFQAGAARTVIGVLVGSVAGLSIFSGLLDRLPSNQTTTLIFLALLVPIRILEWRFLLWWMYREFPFSSGTRRKIITLGILVSFALDVIGIFAALVIPGGIWIC
ncbi:MAG: hypothetical protein JST28_04845 [Acidobacteria bacterium]|nr:hypothetical protein [Acidobacteriota bacterium]